jgi:hypothetical protein
MMENVHEYQRWIASFAMIIRSFLVDRGENRTFKIRAKYRTFSKRWYLKLCFEMERTRES